MRETPPFRDEKDKGITYINGVGFIEQIQMRGVTTRIRGSSNIMCFCTLLYFLMNKALILPVTYLIYFFGGDIQINFFTGLIVASPFVKATILFLTQLGALTFSCIICFLSNRRLIISAKICKMPYRGVTSLAVPMTIAIGLMGTALGFVFVRLCKKIGIVFANSVLPIAKLDTMVGYGLLFAIIFVILQEILFRGIILTSIRQFGDGFAIIATSLLFAVWAGGAGDFISYFFVSLPLCYFAIRSGSVLTAIISRVFYQIVIFLISLSAGILESSLSEVIILLTIILFSLFAAYCFTVFVKNDSKAFILKPPTDNTKLSIKLGIFCSSIVFIFFAAYQLITIVFSSQYIG